MDSEEGEALVASQARLVESRLLGSLLRESREMPTSSRTVMQSLPEDHPFLHAINRSFHTYGVTGNLVMSSDLVSPYRVEVSVPLEAEEGDAMLRAMSTDRAESEIFDGGEEVVDVGGTWSLFSH